MVLQKIALKEITEKRIPVTDFRQTLMIMPALSKMKTKILSNQTIPCLKKLNRLKASFWRSIFT